MRRSNETIADRFLDWLGGHELAILLAFFGIAAGVWTFAAIATDVKDGETQGFDRRVLLSMRHPGDLSPIGSSSVQEAARDVTSLGSDLILGIVTAITAGFLALDGKRLMACFMCAAIAGGAAVSNLLKEIFQRPRPEIVPHIVHVSNTSFPSGHSMMSALTYLTLGALLARSHERKGLRAYFLIVAALLTLTVGVSRVYLGVHWPTDVLAGWTAGTVWTLLCWLVARWLQAKNMLEHEAS